MLIFYIIYKSIIENAYSLLNKQGDKLRSFKTEL